HPRVPRQPVDADAARHCGRYHQDARALVPLPHRQARDPRHADVSSGVPAAQPAAETTRLARFPGDQEGAGRSSAIGDEPSHPGSMPFALIAGMAVGPVSSLIRSRAAAWFGLCADTAAVNMIQDWISSGSGPTTSAPGTERILGMTMMPTST